MEPGQISKLWQQLGGVSEEGQGDLGPGQLPLVVILEVYQSEKTQCLLVKGNSGTEGSLVRVR